MGKIVKIWSRKSRLWKFAAVWLAVYELTVLIAFVFFHGTIGRSFLTPSRKQRDFVEYSQWYEAVYQPEHPNAQTMVEQADTVQVFIYWGTLTLLIYLGRQESRQRFMWKKGLLEAALYVALMFGWFLFLLPRVTHYRLFHAMMPAQAIAIPLLVQLATHPDLPRKGEPE